MPRVLLVHTVRTLVDDFDRKVRKAIPAAEPFHLLDELLLERIRLRGHVANEDAERLESHLTVGQEIGAAAALITCSTLSQCAIQVRRTSKIRILTIDEALIDAIVGFRGSIVVLATNPTTVEPTRQSLASRGAQTGAGGEVGIHVIPDAFAALQRGDLKAHDAMVRAAVGDALHRYDRVSLAQASMARATETLTEDEQKRVLTSPDLAIERLASMLKRDDEMGLKSELSFAEPE
jgi:hypothetical protein